MTFHNISQKLRSLSRRHITLLAILLFALTIRLIYAFSSQFTPDVSDMRSYNSAAKSILDGESLVSVDEGDYYNFTKPPGYPVFLSAIYIVAGRDNLRAVYVAQAALSTLTLLLIYLMARNRFGPRPALIAVGLGAVFTDMVLYNITLMTETLALFLVAFGLWALSRLPITRVSLAMGSLAFGLAILAKPAVLYFLPGIALWVLVGSQFSPRARLAQVLVVGTFVALPLAPWMVANLRAGGGLAGFGPGAMNLWAASDARVLEGGWPQIPRNGKTDAEIQDELMREALQNIRDRPATYVRGVSLRLSSALGADRDGGLEPLLIPTSRADRLWHESYFRWRAGEVSSVDAERIINPRWLALAIHLPTMAAIFFGTIGIIWSAKGSRQDWLLWLAMASYIAGLIFVTAGDLRFRLMVAPILIVYAGYGLYLVTGAIGGFRPMLLSLTGSRKLLTTCTVLVVLLVNFGFSLRGFFGGLL